MVELAVFSAGASLCKIVDSYLYMELGVSLFLYALLFFSFFINNDHEKDITIHI